MSQTHSKSSQEVVYVCSAVRLSSEDPCHEPAGGGEGGLPLGIDLRSWAVDLMERLFDAAATLQGSRETAGTTDDACAPHLVCLLGFGHPVTVRSP